MENRKNITDSRRRRIRFGLRWSAAFALLGSATAWAADTVTNTVAESASAATNRVARTKTWMTFGLDRVHFLRSELLGNPIWQYLASLIYIVLAFYSSKLLDYLVQTQLRRWAARSQLKINDLLVDLLRGPIKIIAFVVLLHVGLRVFEWPEWEAGLISKGLKIIVGYSLTYLALKLVDLMMGFWEQRIAAAHGGLLDVQLIPVLRKTFKIFVVVVAVLVIAQNLEMNVTGLLASLSIGGLAVGLAAQDTLSNLFGAVAIFADKPFRIGDQIQLDSIAGTVETIGLRSTRVRNGEGSLVTIPNKNMAAANIINVSRRPGIRTVMNIGLTYDTPAPKIERALAIIQEIFRSHAKTADLLVTFNKFDSSALNIQVSHLWNSTNFNEYAQGLQKLNLELKRRFDEEKMDFAFPSHTVYLRQDSQWQVANSHEQQEEPQPVRPSAGRPAGG
ncbi:MAG: hypothetical protein C5B50_07610 [Verrucomicrobia bacterium]|nr:MAG: hypothetical protein C5B50_07610 [Verrucomicrobiota bacterium]